MSVGTGSARGPRGVGAPSGAHGRWARRGQPESAVPLPARRITRGVFVSAAGPRAERPPRGPVPARGEATGGGLHGGETT